MKNRIRMAGVAAVCAGLATVAGVGAPSAGAATAKAAATTAARPNVIVPACAYTSAEPLVKYGNKGTAVRQAQCELDFAYAIHWNDFLTMDGDFGPSTRTVTRLFQSCAGIPVDGIIGPQTWAALDFWVKQVNFCGQ